MARQRQYVGVRLTPTAWLGLWWNGRRDARRGLPAWPPVEGAPALTPQLRLLESHAGEVFESERMALVADVDVLSGELDVVRAQRPVVLAELDKLLANRPPAKLGADELERRRTGEDALELAVVQRRRRREHERAQAVDSARVSELRIELQRLDAELVLLPKRIRRRHEEAAARVEQFAHFTARRAAVYWRALVRTHPKGHALATVARDWSPPIPEWTAVTTQPADRTDVAHSTGVPA